MKNLAAPSCGLEARNSGKVFHALSTHLSYIKVFSPDGANTRPKNNGNPPLLEKTEFVRILDGLLKVGKLQKCVDPCGPGKCAANGQNSANMKNGSQTAS